MLLKPLLKYFILDISEMEKFLFMTYGMWSKSELENQDMTQ